jgi:Ca2+-binding RTX toxin-like protein
MTQTINGTDPGNPSNPDGIDFIQVSGGGAILGSTFSGFEAVIGSYFNDVLTGHLNTATEIGGVNGADTPNGGNGNDMLMGDSFRNLLVDASSGGADTLNGGDDDDYLAGGVLGDTLTGDAGANVLNGGGGDDKLLGDADADTMTGGIGDDSYEVDDAGDIVTELAGEGHDHVTASIDYTLGSEIEDLTLTGLAIYGLANLIEGNDQDNVLNGAAGGNGDDRLFGGNDGDLLAGDAGNDRLAGGQGADIFAFGSPADGIDGITDWEAEDMIQLDRAGFGLSPSDSLALVNGTDATGLSGDTLFYETTSGLLYWHDGDSDTLTAFARLATTPASLDLADFALV